MSLSPSPPSLLGPSPRLSYLSNLSVLIYAFDAPDLSSVVPILQASVSHLNSVVLKYDLRLGSFPASYPAPPHPPTRGFPLFPAADPTCFPGGSCISGQGLWLVSVGGGEGGHIRPPSSPCFWPASLQWRVVCRSTAELLFLARAFLHIFPQLFPLFFLGLRGWGGGNQPSIGECARARSQEPFPGSRVRWGLLESHRWAHSWFLAQLCRPPAGISLSGPWESGLQAAHSSRLQLLFCSHLTPLGPSPVSLLLLQPWTVARWASPTRNFPWEGVKGSEASRLWLPPSLPWALHWSL